MPPVAGFDWTGEGHACEFWSTSSDDLVIASHTWDFGDGSAAATDSAVAHTSRPAPLGVVVRLCGR